MKGSTIGIITAAALAALSSIVTARESIQSLGRQELSQDARLDAADRRGQVLKFSPCAENPTLDCGTLQVPVSYDEPHGEGFNLSVIRARATDMIRRALGEARISYVGGSYGTVLGATYASLFPRRVRAMMLDGGVFSCPALPVDFSTSAGSRSAALAVSVWGSCAAGQLPGRK